MRPQQVIINQGNRKMTAIQHVEFSDHRIKRAGVLHSRLKTGKIGHRIVAWR